MGWFDDDDESDEDPPPPTSSGAGTALSGGIGDGEEEDPLDAYMNSLAAEPNRRCRPEASAGGRLDQDAEDESTSHWESSSAARSSSSGAGSSRRLLSKLPADDDDDDDDDDGFALGSQARSARSAISSTFVKAGGKKRGENANDDDDDDNDDGSGAKDPRDQEIDPLDRVDHRGVRYDPFRRRFRRPADTGAGRAWREAHEVVCNPSKFDPVLGFGELAEEVDGEDGGEPASAVFPPELIRAVAKAGYDSPTLVQSQTLSVALAGRDALVTAATGSGKTLAYVWPMVVHCVDQREIVPGTDGPIGLVLTPTRELAKQVHAQMQRFLSCLGGRAIEVAGGNRGTWELIKDLRRGCEVVVSTPGRLIDVVKGKGTNLRRVTMIVMDEADRMLDLGFEKQVSSIMENVRPDRQTMLLSATFGKRVEKVARSWLRDPVRIAIGRTGASSEHVDQHVLVLPSRGAKVQWLSEMLPVLAGLGRCLVFVATRADCDHLAQEMKASPSMVAASNGAEGGIAIACIHGEKDQRDRNAALSVFKKRSRAVLIATDVAARGLDVPDVISVVNFDAAKNLDSHVHRVGRAGRLSKDMSSAGGGGSGGEHRRGVAYTLLSERNADFAQSLVDAFEREGREASQELVALSQKCKRFGGGRSKHSKSGLGHADDSFPSRPLVKQCEKRSHGESVEGNYYGPPSKSAPIKRNRWG